MTVSLSLLAGAGWQFFDDNGTPLTGGLLYTYEAGTTTPLTTYTDVNGNVANANPIVLDAAGRVPYQVWLSSTDSYKFILKTSTGVTVWTEDNVGGAVTLDQLSASGGSALVGFIQAGAGAVTRTAQAKMREPVSFEDFGATGDGVANDFPSATAALLAHDVIELTDSAKYNFNASQNGLFVPSNKTIRGNGQSELLSTSVNYRPLNIDNAVTKPENVVIQGVTLRNNVSNNDDWAPVRYAGARSSMYHGNHTKQSFYGATFTYSAFNDATEIRTTSFSATGNLAQGNGTGFEIFSVKNAAFAGNVSYKNGTQGTNHGIRVTGYGAAQPAPGTDLKVFGLALAGHAVDNYSNGISQQTGVYGAAYAGLALTNTTNGIQTVTVNSSADDVSKGNVFSGVAMHSTVNGMRLEKTEKHVFSGFAVRQASFYGVGLLTTSSTSTFGTGRYNRFDGAIYDHGTGSNPLLIEGNNNRVDVTIADIAAAGNSSVISGNFNVVTITGGGFPNAVSAFLNINGNNNVVIIAANDVAQAFSEIIVFGNNNTVICNLDVSDGGGEIIISGGTGNQIIGHCNITGTFPAGNRIDGVFYGQAQGVTTATTDASGDISVSYGYTLTGQLANHSVLVSQQTASGGTPYFLQVHSKTTAGCKVRVFDAAGLAVTATSVTVAWKATAT